MKSMEKLQDVINQASIALKKDDLRVSFHLLLEALSLTPEDDHETRMHIASLIADCKEYGTSIEILKNINVNNDSSVLIDFLILEISGRRTLTPARSISIEVGLDRLVRNSEFPDAFLVRASKLYLRLRQIGKARSLAIKARKTTGSTTAFIQLLHVYAENTMLQEKDMPGQFVHIQRKEILECIRCILSCENVNVDHLSEIITLSNRLGYLEEAAQFAAKHDIIRNTVYSRILYCKCLVNVRRSKEAVDLLTEVIDHIKMPVATSYVLDAVDICTSARRYDLEKVLLNRMLIERPQDDRIRPYIKASKWLAEHKLPVKIESMPMRLRKILKNLLRVRLC